MGTPPLSAQGTYAPGADSNETLRRIEQNTSSLLTWVKVATTALIVLVIVNILFL